LIFSNSSADDAPHVRAIREACARAGIAVDMAGFKAGKSLARPEDTLGSYDIVFAKARAAIEAAAVGSAVVLCDVAGAGPMVTTTNFDALRRVNFGMRALRETPTAEGIAREISRYDPADAAWVSSRVRDTAGHEAQVDRLMAIYDDILAEPSVPDANAELRAAADYLRRLSPKLHEWELLRMAFARLLRLPVAGTWMRKRARREQSSHWFQELLRAMDGD
jgi:hypothetical protein